MTPIRLSYAAQGGTSLTLEREADRLLLTVHEPAGDTLVSLEPQWASALGQGLTGLADERQALSDLDHCDPALLAEFLDSEHVSGSFHRALATCLRLADPFNRRRLYRAFLTHFSQALAQQRQWAAAVARTPA